jgi:hypothetical protein
LKEDAYDFGDDRDDADPLVPLIEVSGFVELKVY